METFQRIGNYKLMVNYISPWVEWAEKVYGKVSAQYLKASINKSRILFSFSKYDDWYKLLLDNYELAKELYGSENNIDSSIILLGMADVKTQIKEFEDALNLINKAKKIEALVSSEYSNKYKVLINAENKIITKAENAGVILKKKEGLISLIAPNTPFKLSLYTLGLASIIGILYATKKKSN